MNYKYICITYDVKLYFTYFFTLYFILFFLFWYFIIGIVMQHYGKYPQY